MTTYTHCQLCTAPSLGKLTCTKCEVRPIPDIYLKGRKIKGVVPYTYTLPPPQK